MYPVERYLRTLKSYVRNKAQPEGSMAEAYIADECLTFCSSDEASKIFPIVGRPSGKAHLKLMDPESREMAHLYVLKNNEEVWPFIEEFKNSLPKMRLSELKRRFNSQFPTWFNKRVIEIHSQGLVSNDLRHLAKRPSTRYKTYSCFIANGYKFHRVERQNARKTQNCGVLCRGDEESTDKEYYGKLLEVWELEYVGRNKIHLFKCHWFDVRNKTLGYRVDNYAITSANAHRELKKNEPFILASQAEQVFYVEDPKDSNWLVVMKSPPRNVWDMPAAPDPVLDDMGVSEMDDVEALQDEYYDPHARVTSPLDCNDECPNLKRVDVDEEEVSLEDAQKIKDQLRSVGVSIDDEENEFHGETLYDSEEDEYEEDSEEDIN